MMTKRVIVADDAPAAIGPYSAAIRSGDLIFASGSLGVEVQTGKFAPGGVEAETRQALENLKRVLIAGGSSLDQVVKTTVFLRDMGDFAKMNAVYAEFFPVNPPARSTIQVAALPKNAAVEIEAIAHLPADA